MTYVNVIQSWGGDDLSRLLTLYVAGTPAGQTVSRADYWSLSIEQAKALGVLLIEQAALAERDRGTTHYEAPNVNAVAEEMRDS